VTGLGVGVDATGMLAAPAVDATIEVLERFGEIMGSEAVDARAAMATSASRDASNRDQFLQRAATALGVMPELIAGRREGALAYAGATSDLGDDDWLVSDIGGGSTELVNELGAVSVDIGSVRLTDRMLPDRPVGGGTLTAAIDHVMAVFEGIEVSGRLVGVAGTWTSLAAIALGLDEYDRSRVHHSVIDRETVGQLVDRLAASTLAETQSIPALDPARAPVILAGAVVALCVMDVTGSGEALISERDTLDGRALELLGLR
jgi:exopolyphosphatase / guanosine-5'-triphosphate,3'-diphosphate pyrophosphatase